MTRRENGGADTTPLPPEARKPATRAAARPTPTPIGRSSPGAKPTATPRTVAPDKTPPAPRLVRYGLYEMPAVLEISDVRGLTQLGRLLGDARPGEVVHAVMRPAELISARNALARLEKLLRSVQARMAGGLIVVESCSQCATRLMRPRQAVPARSILRLAG